MTADVTPTRTLPPPLVRSLRLLARTYLTLAWWFVGIFGVLWLGAIIIAVQFGPVAQSMAQFARQGSTWFPLSIAIMAVSAYHAVHIAAGMTRRTLGTAMLIVSALMAVIVTAVVVGLFAVEIVLYDANGWQHRIVDNSWFPAAPDDLLAIAGWNFLLVMAAQVSGLLIGVVYLRAGAWRGTLSLPLTAGPVFGIWWALARGVQVEWLTTGVRIGLAVLATLAMATAYLVLLRGIQLRPART